MNEEFEGLGLVELIDLLEEVPAPPAIPMTPQTPGWIVLGAPALIFLFLAGRWLWRRWKANAYRRAALDELSQAGHDPVRIAEILRRTALAAFPRSEVAPLAGDAWLAFLDRTYPGNGFANGPGTVLATAPYSDTAPSPDLSRLATDWVRRHARPE